MRVASGQAFTPGSATGADLQAGDPVRYLAAGDTIEDVDLTESIWGVVIGVQQVLNTAKGVLEPATRVASGVVYGTNLEHQTIVLVVPGDSGIWEIDSSQTYADQAAAQAISGANADLVFTTTAADLNGTPRLGAAIASGAAGQLRILGPSPTMENRFWDGANLKFLVEVNESQRPPFTTTGNS
jgi:hypothetical protein